MAISKIQSDSINDSAITADQIAAGAVTVADIPDGEITVDKLHTQVQGALGTRNLIINGDMRIAQRGTTPTTGNVYLIDRWKQVRVLSSASVEMSQSIDVPTAQGFYNSIKLNVTSAGALSSGNYHRIDQKIEGQNIQHIKWGTASPEKLTLSFWVKSNYTGSFVATLNPETGSTNSISYVINAVDTWEKKTLTFTDTTSTAPLANDNTTQLSLYFYTAVGASTFTETLNNYINITGVQLEVGDTATPFEHRPYDIELARCQRYYYNYYGTTLGQATNLSSEGMFFQSHPIEMRAAPTVTILNTVANIGTTVGNNDASSPHFNINRSTAYGFQMFYDHGVAWNGSTGRGNPLVYNDYTQKWWSLDAEL